MVTGQWEEAVSFWSECTPGELAPWNTMTLARSSKTLEGKSALGFATLPWTSEKSQALKGGPGTASAHHNSQHLYSG